MLHGRLSLMKVFLLIYETDRFHAAWAKMGKDENLLKEKAD